jgi:arabinose-5-phosphate isomerase
MTTHIKIPSDKKTQLGSSLEVARSILNQESQALALASRRIGTEIEQAVDLILNNSGKIIVTGIGKSGHVGKKIAATLSSTGNSAVFLHAAEAVHGDLGVYRPGDITIVISNSGATAELLKLIPTLREFQSPIIAIVGNLKSPLAKQANVVLDASIPQEADPLGIVPTTSTTLAMALGDALAGALMVARNFEKSDFARFHPAGQLGRNLLLEVGTLMHRSHEIAIVTPTTSLKEVVIAMTERPLGASVVRDASGILIGLITDGDIRRTLKTHDDIRTVKAEEVMTHNPITIPTNMLVGEAIDVMENRPNQIAVLPVVDPKTQECIGLFRIHDAHQPHHH